jgi:hypothetical protein
MNSQLDEKEHKNSLEDAKGVPRKSECCIKAKPRCNADFQFKRAENSNPHQSQIPPLLLVDTFPVRGVRKFAEEL